MTERIDGIDATWFLGDDAIVIRYGRGRHVPELFDALGRVTVPHAAIARVRTGPGLAPGTTALRLDLREGACPLLDAAANRLGESVYPYRLTLPAGRPGLSTEHRAALARVATTPGPAPRYLVAAPSARARLRGFDGEMAFDGRTVALHWYWTGASPAKLRVGDVRLPLAGLVGVEWQSSTPLSGHLRVLRADEPAPPPPERDPGSIVFGAGYGLAHESLPFAAALAAAIAERRAESAATSATSAAGTATERAADAAGAPGPRDTADAPTEL
ncbi:DUF4429 domain-containing protein [Embleya sp. NBC_00896]|uniref:DUF4429 domain-containing protein n=1 Tax=Embleya sp. NBC_00896 TaxID=2975961 RepID=UPI00386E49A4|nr:DUF4429 domain-containing protein [Embleya sp. NBC_00896]